VPPHRYDLIALDLDGTLLDSAGRVSAANQGAILAARQAGVRVTICTGRGLVESRSALDQIKQADPVVVAGGAIVSCPQTSRTEHRFAVSENLVQAAVDTIHAHKAAALVLKDPVEAGYDYLVVTGHEGFDLDPVTRWWFKTMNVGVKYVQTLAADPHPEHTVRVGACASARTCEAMMRDLHVASKNSATIHHFPAVVAPDSARITDEGETLHVLELFHADANKWSAIRVLAQRWNIPHTRIAAVGDQINDVSMLEGSGLGIAMGNAVDAAKNVAQRHTHHHNDDGVAHAIHNILSGSW
jgi:5-amino-6-(5-phospho-D-ribitylamino)uracil phosphatase